jgi:hypothetical protein
MTVKNTYTNYYKNFNGIVKSGNEWLDDYKFEDIEKEDLILLKECFWEGRLQRWTTETEE